MPLHYRPHDTEIFSGRFALSNPAQSHRGAQNYAPLLAAIQEPRPRTHRVESPKSDLEEKTAEKSEAPDLTPPIKKAFPLRLPWPPGRKRFFHTDLNQATNIDFNNIGPQIPLSPMVKTRISRVGINVAKITERRANSAGSRMPGRYKAEVRDDTPNGKSESGSQQAIVLLSSSNAEMERVFNLGFRRSIHPDYGIAHRGKWNRKGSIGSFHSCPKLPQRIPLVAVNAERFQRP